MFMKQYDYDMYRNNKTMRSLRNDMTKIYIWNDMTMKHVRNGMTMIGDGNKVYIYIYYNMI